MFNSNLVAAVNASMGSRFEPSKQSTDSPNQSEADSDSDSSKETNSHAVSSLDAIYLASLFQELEQERHSNEEFIPQFDKLLKEKSVSEKLKGIFKLPKLEQFKGEFRCALIRSIMLQGIMYITEENICFHAYFPREQDIVLKEGILSKRAYGIYERYFFSLQNDVLVYYYDQLDQYCPLEIIDLKYAIKVEKEDSSRNRFKIVTPKRTYYFQADSLTSMEEWVTQLQRSIVRASNDGDHVKIVIPIGTITNIDKDLSSSFPDTIQIKTIDRDENCDEYFFAFISDSQKLFDILHNLWSQNKELIIRTQCDTKTLSPELTIAGLSVPNLFSGWKPFSIHKRSKSIDETSTTTTTSKSFQSSNSDSLTEQGEIQSSVTRKLSRRVNILIQNPIKYISTFNENPQEETKRRFREHFALPESEQLHAVFYGYFLRMIPLYGKFYVSDNYVCYRSRVPGQTTNIKLPISAIHLVKKQNPTILGYYGLEILIKSQQEMFFDFGFKDIRDRFVELLEHLKNNIVDTDKKQPLLDSSGSSDESHTFYSIVQNTFIKDQLLHKKLSENCPPGSPIVSNYGDIGTMTTLKIEKAMHITCLTIGSRGDVQPYIALAKGLMKEGHKVRIATHGEYKDWIESHGIEFGYVGGNPAELMRICVENGMFTLGFFREGVTNFRGWLDDLLKTSWDACQGTDLIIESPSAMSGIHIAEALEIPYFRAFTMPWTRTRTYPHAFAVPYHDLKGPYNYSSYVLIENAFWRGISPQVNRWRKNTLGLRSTNMDKMDAATVPFLYNFSSKIVPRPYDWSDWICITGYWFLDNPDIGWEAPNSLIEFLNNNRKINRKIVYIGFGSIVVDDPKALTKTIVEAVTKSGVAAILSKGWSDRLQGKVDNNEEEDFPEYIYPLKSVPHDWLFPEIDAVVHHGGAGTTAAGLRAGKPTIIKPFFGDQFFWGDRIEGMGIGFHVRKLTAEKLSDCLIRATSDELMIEKSKLVGKNIKKEDGVLNAIQALYKNLEHAKQRIISQRLRAAGNGSPTSPSNVDDMDVYNFKLAAALKR